MNREKNEIREISNYHPISISNMFSKVIVRIVLNRMIDLLKKNSSFTVISQTACLVWAFSNISIHISVPDSV